MGKIKQPSALQVLDSSVAKLEGGKTQAKLAKVRSTRVAIQKVLAANPDYLELFLKGVFKFKKKG